MNQSIAVSEKKSLIAKLAEACDAVGGVEKNGRNESKNYRYVKAADVAKAIRHQLFKRGILVLIDEKEWTQERMLRTNSGAELPIMLLKGEVTFRDEDTVLGPFGAFATAFDTGDKAIFKAKTGLLKYALRGLGLIPDEKDDPEADERTDEETDPAILTGRRRGSAKETDKKTNIKNFQVRAWASTCFEKGRTNQQQADFLSSRFKVVSISDLTQEQFDEAIKWAASQEPLEKTLETGVAAIKAKRQKPPRTVVEALDAIDDFDQSIAGD